jgi:hypothetical protein
MFAGLQRVDIGEHIRYQANKLYKSAHWYPYAQPARYRSIAKAAEATAALAIDRISRFDAIANPVISDLTGGLDSRLLSSAVHAAGLEVTVTVNGPPESEDVRISHKIAETMDWDMRYFDIQSLWSDSITPEMRRELIYRTNGELPFTEIYHHLLSRPRLGQEFNLHIIGMGAELGSPHTWEGGLKMRYGSLALERPPTDLFIHDLCSGFVSRLKPRIQAHSCQHLGALTTQQWDATWIWKMTGHSSLYLSAVHNWLPSVAPMLGAEVVQTTTAMPAKWRIASQLERHEIACLAPRTAEFESWDSPQQEYRGTAQPGLKTVSFEMYRYTRRLARIFERKVLKGILSRRSGRTVTLVTQGRVPVFTPEFRRFLDPETMYSRALYATDGLRHLLSGDKTQWYSRLFLIVGLAQVEQLCRELDFRPEPDFWAPVLTSSAAQA